MSRIMDISPYALSPASTGGQKGILGFIQSLAKQHEVTLVTQSHCEPILGVRNDFILGKSVLRYINPLYFFTLRKRARKYQIEHIIVEQPYFAWLGYLLAKSTGIPWHIHTHNIEYHRFKSLGKWWWPLLLIYERWALRHANNVFFKTGKDMALAASTFGLASSKCWVVPYGVPIASNPPDKAQCRALVRQQHQLSEDSPLLLFFGAMSYKPNVDAVLLFVRHIYPILKKAGFHYHLLICGKSLKDEVLRQLQPYPEIQYVGFVDDIDQYTKAADVVINPVLSGGGIKTKIVEAIALGTNVVSTSTGAIGVEATICDSKLQVIADDNPEAFAIAIMHAIAASQPTPESFYKHFYWDNIASGLDAILK